MMKNSTREYSYFTVEGEYSKRTLPFEPTEQIFEEIVKSCARQLFGENGSEFEVKILKVEDSGKKFIVKTLADEYVQVHSALTCADEISVLGHKLRAMFRIASPVVDQLLWLS